MPEMAAIAAVLVTAGANMIMKGLLPGSGVGAVGRPRLHNDRRRSRRIRLASSYLTANQTPSGRAGAILAGQPA